MNLELIQDEEHSNPMGVGELESRMREWLEGQYEAVVFEDDDGPVGYALWRPEPEGIYLRQFFIRRDHRRKGLGRAAIQWLRENTWRQVARIRLDVLVGNARAISFWHAVGFADYCTTMIRKGPGYKPT